MERPSHARQPSELHFASGILISILGMYLKVFMKSSSSFLENVQFNLS